jgi:hypothetical protein
MLSFTSHAKDQAATRALPVEAIAFILEEELRGADLRKDLAVFVARTEQRGEYVGSNGNTIWAIIRGGAVVTVMLRRDNQPATASAMHVDSVIGAERI